MTLPISLATLKSALDGMSPGRYVIRPGRGAVDTKLDDGRTLPVAMATGLVVAHPDDAVIRAMRDAAGFAILKNHADTLLEIAAAALALGPELVYLRGPLSERLRDAIGKVKP